MNREIEYIVVHCAATPPRMDIGVKEIRLWHQNKGWTDIGYHYVIRRSGELETGRPEERQGAHAKGYNRNSIGICLVGGVDENQKPQCNFEYHQMEALRMLLITLKQEYPNAKVLGHRDLPKVKKACPSFDVREWLDSQIGVFA